MKGNRAKGGLISNRNYLTFMSGQLVSYTTTQVAQIVLPLLILSLTHSAWWASAAGVLRSAPYVGLSLPVGVLLDRLDRKAVMRSCEAMRITLYAAVLVITVIGRPDLWVFLLLALLDGTLFVFFDIAEIATIPQLVTPEQLNAAGAHNIVNYSIATLLGPALAGILYGVGKAPALSAEVVGYAVSFSCLLLVNCQFQGTREATGTNFLGEIRQGIAWLGGHRSILLLGILLGGNYFCTAGIPVTLMVVGEGDSISTATVGVVIATAGAGSIIGAAVAPWLAAQVRSGVLLTISPTIQAVALGALVFTRSLIAIALLLVCSNMMLSIFDVVQRAHRMRLIPDHLQARVNSVYRLILFGGTPLGMSLSGALLSTSGPSSTLGVFAAGVALLALAANCAPSIRKL